MTGQEFRDLKPGDLVIGTCLVGTPYTKTYLGWIGVVARVLYNPFDPDGAHFEAKTLQGNGTEGTLFTDLNPRYFNMYIKTDQDSAELTYRYV
jgi:hypothetical protein